MNFPLITIITVTFNAVESIGDTILSVINQTYPNIEYIIIDGGSTDGTLDIIKKNKDYIDLLVSEPDKGIYDAMNKGIGFASGEWVNFMNSGDKFYLNSTILNLFSKKIQDNKLVVYGDVCLSFENNIYLMPASSIDKLDFELPFCHQSTFVRSSYLKGNTFSLNYKVSSDYNLFYNIYKQGKNSFLYIPVIVAIYNFDLGFSVKNNITCLKEYKSISTAKSSDLNYNITYLKECIKGILPKKISKYLKKRVLEKLYTKM